MRWYSWSSGLLSLISLAVVLSAEGFRMSGQWKVRFQHWEAVVAAAWVMQLVVGVIWNRSFRWLWQEARVPALWTGLCLVIAVVVGFWDMAMVLRDGAEGTVVEGVRSLVRLYVTGMIGLTFLRWLERLFRREARPEWLLFISFLGLICVGTLLLLLPAATARAGTSLSVVDALFTATSAACVTGLTVANIAQELSPLGLGIVFFLIQVGGLGIMTFVAFLSVMSREELPLLQVVSLKSLLGARSYGDVRRQILAIVVGTVVVEAMGAGILAMAYDGPGGLGHRLAWGGFHAVSAFCNAGLSWQADSFGSFVHRPVVLLTIAALVIVGGLGFVVMPDFIRVGWHKVWPNNDRMNLSRWRSGRPLVRLSLQTRISLWVTAVLLGIGTVGFWILERNGGLKELSFGTQWLVSFFQAVVPRTAGFTVVDIGTVRPATWVLLIILMAVGACPVSTGGGMKTVTLGVLILTVRAWVRGRERVEAFGRTIPQKVVYAASAMLFLYVMVVAVATFLVACFDPQLGADRILFEVVSALSTVGLSTGITPQLSVASKLVLILTMFIGRVGPISVVLAVMKRGREVEYEFAEEEMIIG